MPAIFESNSLKSLPGQRPPKSLTLKAFRASLLTCTALLAVASLAALAALTALTLGPNAAMAPDGDGGFGLFNFLIQINFSRIERETVEVWIVGILVDREGAQCARKKLTCRIADPALI